MYVSAQIASKELNVSAQCLRTWANDGKIKYITTKGGHRRYLLEEQQIQQGKKIIYARVSSKKQQDDLHRQIQFLRQKYPNHEVVKDIGSGINYKRLGFKRILEGIFTGTIQEVVVAQKDRFTRFGFDLFEWIFQQHGANLICDQKEDEQRQDELTDDLMSIITVFTARYYGRRNYQPKGLL